MGPKAKYSDLKKIIVISILNYSFINLPEYVTKTVRVADKHREYEINNDVTYYYIELEKFRNKNPDMKQPINQWLAFIDMERGDLLEMAEKENISILAPNGETIYGPALENEANKLVFEKKILTGHKIVMTTEKGDEEVKRLAEIRLMSHLEEQAALATARDKGIEQGLEEGKKQGLEQGEKQGLEQGKKEGIEQGKKEGIEQGKKEITLQIAKKMKKQKIDIETISQTTGLTAKEIEGL